MTYHHSQWSEFINLVSLQRSVPVEALFVHCWDDIRENMIDFTVRLFRTCGAKKVILNSIPEFEVGKPGFAYWKQALCSRGISEADIMAIPPATHTNAEAMALADIAKAHGLASIGIISVPMHIPRAFLTDLGVMRKAGLSVKLTPYTLWDVDWSEEITIGVLNGPSEKTTRLGRLAGEFARIINYHAEAEKGNPDFNIASIEEGIEYLKKSLSVS